MCGRYANHIRSLKRWETILGEWPADLPTGFNVAPTQDAPVATEGGFQVMRWGLVPSWSKQPKTKYSTINARAEKLVDSPAYRGAWRQGRRCLVPALGFYEWRRVGETKQPYFIGRSDGEPLMFAGIWDRWAGDGAEAFCSYSIITTTALPEIEHIHARMPLMLPPELGQTWLKAEAGSCIDLLQPQSVDALVTYPVATTVNNPRNQGPELMREITP